MEPAKHLLKCETLLQNCKREAKQLLEANVTNRKIHWTHPSFISFCNSVEDILTYGVHRKYRVSGVTRNNLTSSGRVLEELSKVYPVARTVYNMCYRIDNKKNGRQRRPVKPDYSTIQMDMPVEHKILWIRTALLEKILKPIVEEILRKPELYYSKFSILSHSVYGEIFCFLLDGPCSITFSRMKSVDSLLVNPAPSEIVSRYRRVIPTSSDQTINQDTPSGEVWEHVQSLYQTCMSTCLFGKNNILMQPPGFSFALEGYLTLVQIEDSLLLKWLPNILINRTREHEDDTSLLWLHILSLDITNDVAHAHCHQGAGHNESEIILIGYNGIAYPMLSFPQPSSLIHFLEAMENGLHPRGCLEPPLWFLRQPQKFRKRSDDATISSTIRNIAVHGSPTAPVPVSSMSLLNEEGFPATWNQVFRVRFSRQERVNGDTTAEWDEGIESKDRLLSPTLPDNVPFTNSSNVVRTVLPRRLSSSRELEQFQCKVTQQLLARYFYSWLSYCRHIARVKTSLSHLIIHPHNAHSLEETSIEERKELDESLWKQFLSSRDEVTWLKVANQIYNGGIPSHLRKEVWPYLLKVFPTCTKDPDENDTILKHGKEEYQNVLEEWKALERTYYRNNDPTSTSLAIRLGMPEPTPQNPVPVVTTEVTTDGVDSLNDIHDTGLIRVGGVIDIHQHLASDVPKTEQSLDVEGVLRMSPDHRMTDESTEELSDLETDEDAGSGSEDRPHSSELSQVAMDTDTDGEVQNQSLTTERETKFLDELIKIDKDIPRCDRDYWYFKNPFNLTKLRNIITSYIWKNLEFGYSQGMCDLLAPLLVVFDDEGLTFSCFQQFMRTMDQYFPPKTGVTQRMDNLRALLQILESDFFQYLTELPMGDALFYSYRWFLVNFKREFDYNDIYLLWETCWSAQWCTSKHFEVFIAMGLLQQYKNAIMDAQLDASEILNLFTELADKESLNCTKTILFAQNVVSELQLALDSHIDTV